MTDQELMQQALDALNHVNVQDRVQIITALRERLAQPEQEPFCYHDWRNIVGKEYADHSDVFPLYTEPPLRKPEPLEAAVGTAYKTGWEHGKAVEREACAKLADEVVEGKRWFNDLPAAIRARGKA